MCRDLTARLGLLGTAINLTAGRGSAGVVAASDDHCLWLDELQFSAGEGPCYDAIRLNRPVLTPDLAAEAGRWPGYTFTAIEAGVTGVFAFPLQVGVTCLGVLDVYADRAGSLPEDHEGASLALARRATEILLDGGPGLGDQIDHRAEIYQAQGMVMAEHDLDPAQAMARMRAYAFTRGQALLELARGILAGRERLDDH